MIFMPALSAQRMQQGDNAANILIDIRGFQISITLDDSCGALPNLSRTSIRIYRGDTDVTPEVFPEGEGRNSDDLIKAVKWVEGFFELDRS